MSGGAAPGSELLRVFARASGVLIRAETVHSVLALVVRLAGEAIPGADGAGVTVLRNNHPAGAASSPAVRRADTLQYDLEEGPGPTARRSGGLVRVDDVASDTRWPRWAAAALRLGLRSALAAPLTAAGETLGAITLQAERPNAFPDTATEVLALFARTAGVLVANVLAYDDAQRLATQLREALESRDVIGQAKGILMATRGIDEQAAFEVLVAMSQQSHRKLVQVARSLTQSLLPPPP